MRVAGYEIRAVEAGRFALDGGAMFGIVPKVLWERTDRADESNRIELAARTLLLRGHGRTILVDTGLGTKLGEKERRIYRAGRDGDSLAAGLESAGVSVEGITDVILTHLHFDHAGGATRLGGGGQGGRGGRPVPAFPGATYHVQARNFEWASHPSERDRGSYLAWDFAPLRQAGCLHLVEGPGELFDGIHLEVVDGHTFGQQLVRVEGGDRTLLFCGDLVPTASHVPLPYVMGYDLQPLVTVREKADLLSRAVAGQWVLVLEHDPRCEAIRVGRGRKGIEVRERFALEGAMP